MKLKHVHWTRRPASWRNSQERDPTEANILMRLAAPLCFKWICQNSINWKREKKKKRPLQCRNSAFPPESTQVWLDDRFKIRCSLGSDGRGLVHTDLIPFPSQHRGYFTARHEEDLCKSHRWISYTARQDKWLSEFMEQNLGKIMLLHGGAWGTCMPGRLQRDS